VSGRGAGVLEQARDLAAQTWASPGHGTGRTCRAARPSAAVGRAEDRAGARGAEEREGPAAERGDEHAGHRVGAAGVGRRRTDVVTAHRRVCVGGAAMRRLSVALLVKDLEVARRRACEVAKRAQHQRRSEGEGPNGFGLARPRMRARVFYRWPARLVSTGVCTCKATGHARAS
jgi:hypothetical protein